MTANLKNEEGKTINAENFVVFSLPCYLSNLFLISFAFSTLFAVFIPFKLVGQLVIEN